MNDTIHCFPKPSYWFIGIVVYPVACFVFTAVLIRPLLLLADVDLRGGPLLLTWLIVTVAVAVWAYVRDYRRLFYTLTPDALILGRGASATLVPFTEIQSIVLTLPDSLPWWLRIQRFNPKGRHLYHNVRRGRDATLLLRLTQHRYLPLNLTYSFLRNGPAFMTELLRLNQSKLVGFETYTDAEVHGLAAARANTLKTIVPNG